MTRAGPSEIGAADSPEPFGSTSPGGDDGSASASRAASESGEALVRASGVTFLSAAINLALAVVRTKVIAVTLGPVGVGALANLGVYQTFTTILGSAASGQALTRAIAEARSLGDQRKVDFLNRYGLIVPTGLGLLIAAATVALHVPLSQMLFGSEAFGPILIAGAAAVPLTLLGASISQIIQGYVRIASVARANILTVVIASAISIGAVLVYGLLGVVIAGIAGAGIQIIMLVWRERWVVRRELLRVAGTIPLRDVIPVLELGFYSTVLGIASAVTSLLIRSAMVSELGLERTGVYQPAAAVSETYLEVLIASTSLYLFPRLTELLSSGRGKEAGRDVGHGLRLLLIVTMPPLVLAIGLPEPLIAVFYSGRFGDAADPLAIQMAGNVLKVVAWSVGAAMLPLGLYRTWLAIGLMLLLIRYVAVVTLLPSLGLEAIAVSYDLAWGWAAFASVLAVLRTRLVPVPARDLFAASAAMAVAFGLLALRYVAPEAAGVAAIPVAGIWLAFFRGDVIELWSAVREPLTRAVAHVRWRAQ